jgi:hypothetical protein
VGCINSVPQTNIMKSRHTGADDAVESAALDIERMISVSYRHQVSWVSVL